MQKRLALMSKGHSMRTIKSVMHNKKSSINDNNASEPARILLESLYAQTQKLEEQKGQDLRLSQDVELYLGKLESDLEVALLALKKKEDDLQEAESKVLLEYGELNHAKEELDRREKEISDACSKKEKLEEELKQANLNLASRALEIEELKLQVKERDRKIFLAQSGLSLKEEELDTMTNELMKRNEEAAKTECELRSKAKLLTEANEIVKRQEVEIQGLRKAIKEREEELEVSRSVSTVEVEKLRVAESNLEKQTVDWLLAQEELKKMAEQADKHKVQANETMEDFKRVKKLLSDVRSELVSSQKALALSRSKTKDQEMLLESNLTELEEKKRSVFSYMKNLENVHLEVESERLKLQVAEARNKELERDLSVEKELIRGLQEELNRERTSLQEATIEMTSLREELERRSNEFQETSNLLEVKESELVEARLEIQHLKSERDSLRHILEERDLELSNARQMLGEVNEDISELRVLMNNREEVLTRAMTKLEEKEEHVQTMQLELDDTKLKFLEAEMVMERIVELTNKMVGPTNDEDHDMWGGLGGNTRLVFEKPTGNFKWLKKQLETELETMRESLRSKEMEVLAAERALVIKDKEVKMVRGRLDERENEIEKMKEELTKESDDLRKLYALAQETIGERSIGDIAVEKLQLEAAQLEVEAATSALQKLSEMGRELLNKASLSIEVDYDLVVGPHNGKENETSTVENNERFGEVKAEVARLSALTEQLVKEAGIVGSAH
ncbi:hypothetical protein LguiB_027576 [Lonicera macranthoides]